MLGWRAQAGQAHYAAVEAGVMAPTRCAAVEAAVMAPTRCAAVEAAVMAPTRCAAVEAAEFGVRVNAVARSLAVHTFLAEVMDEELLDELAEREVFGRGAEPWEVANAIVFLASPYSSYMTGGVVSVSPQHP